MEGITTTATIITIMVWWTEGVGKGEFHHCSLWCSGVEKRIPITKSLWEKLNFEKNCNLLKKNDICIFKMEIYLKKMKL